MATTISARTLEQATEDLPLIGHLFSCDWNGAQVERPILVDRLRAAGLAACTPPAISDQVSLGRALRGWITERAARGAGARLGNHSGLVAELAPGSGEAMRSLVRVARTSASAWILFAVVAESIDLRTLGMDYSTEVRVLVHKQDGTLIVTTEAAGTIERQEDAPPGARQIAMELRPHWERFKRRHTAGDLGLMTRGALRHALGAVGIQEGSGFYFVPLAQAAGLTRLRDLITDLPVAGATRPVTLMLGQLDSRATRRQLALAAHQDFLRQLDAARTDLDAFSQKPDGTVLPKTVAERLTAYRQLRQRVETYADLLGMQQAAIVSGLHELTERAARIVTKHVGLDDAPRTRGGASALPLPLSELEDRIGR